MQLKKDDRASEALKHCQALEAQVFSGRVFKCLCHYRGFYGLRTSHSPPIIGVDVDLNNLDILAGVFLRHRSNGKSLRHKLSVGGPIFFRFNFFFLLRSIFSGLQLTVGRLIASEAQMF